MRTRWRGRCSSSWCSDSERHGKGCAAQLCSAGSTRWLATGSPEGVARPGSQSMTWREYKRSVYVYRGTVRQSWSPLSPLTSDRFLGEVWVAPSRIVVGRSDRGSRLLSLGVKLSVLPLLVRRHPFSSLNLVQLCEQRFARRPVRRSVSSSLTS